MADQINLLYYGQSNYLKAMRLLEID